LPTLSSWSSSTTTTWRGSEVSDAMRAALPWLGQGDIFASIPVATPRVHGDEVTTSFTQGPALLITHDCALDKTNKSGEIKVRRLAFLPLHAFTLLNDNEKGMLRKDAIEPSESLYLPGLSSIGDAYCVLSNAYYLPGEYFGLRLTRFDHPEAEPDKTHLEATLHGERLARLDPDRLQLLRLKWAGYWLRTLPGNPEQDSSSTMRRAAVVIPARIVANARRLANTYLRKR
jgi:hypothetical protein